MPQGKKIALDELALSFQRGEERGYDHFFRLYFRHLCFFAASIVNNEEDAEDIVQACFSKMWARHATINNASSIRSFLYTAVRNACISQLRKRKLSVVSLDANPEFSLEFGEQDYEKVLIEAETIREVYTAAEQLTGRAAEVFRLYFIEGKDDFEIGELLHTSPHTVRNQRKRAIEILRKNLSATR